MGVLDALIYGYRYILNGSNTQAVRRSVLKFVGATVTDDPVTGATVITVTGGGGGGGLPITDGALTALDDVAVTGGKNLVLGSDGALSGPATYKFVTIVATEAIDWSPTGASVMAAYADSVRMHNGRPIMFLEGTDNTTAPAIGKLRFPYNGGVLDKPGLVVKDSAGNDRSLWTYLAGDAHSIGNVFQDLTLYGYNGQSIVLSSGIQINSGAFRTRIFSYLSVESGQQVRLVEKHAPYTLVTGQDFCIVAIDAAGTYTLPPVGTSSDGDTFEICNMSGGNITVAADGGGPNIYGAGATQVLVNGETATYRYNSGAVSTTPFWIRVA